MSAREQQLTRYWPTPAACQALGGHRRTDGKCRVCGDTQPTRTHQQDTTR